MTQVASEAAVMALTLTRAGSRTHASKLSVIPSDLMSTPKLDPLAAASSPLPTAPACFCRSLLKMLLASKPALSQRVLSIIMIVGCFNIQFNQLFYPNREMTRDFDVTEPYL